MKTDTLKEWLDGWLYVTTQMIFGFLAVLMIAGTVAAFLYYYFLWTGIPVGCYETSQGYCCVRVK